MSKRARVVSDFGDAREVVSRPVRVAEAVEDGRDVMKRAKRGQSSWWTMNEKRASNQRKGRPRVR